MSTFARHRYCLCLHSNFYLKQYPSWWCMRIIIYSSSPVAFLTCFCIYCLFLFSNPAPHTGFGAGTNKGNSLPNLWSYYYGGETLACAMRTIHWRSRYRRRRVKDRRLSYHCWHPRAFAGAFSAGASRSVSSAHVCDGWGGQTAHRQLATPDQVGRVLRLKHWKGGGKREYNERKR